MLFHFFIFLVLVINPELLNDATRRNRYIVRYGFRDSAILETISMKYLKDLILEYPSNPGFLWTLRQMIHWLRMRWMAAGISGPVFYEELDSTTDAELQHQAEFILMPVSFSYKIQRFFKRGHFAKTMYDFKNHDEYMMDQAKQLDLALSPVDCFDRVYFSIKRVITKRVKNQKKNK